AVLTAAGGHRASVATEGDAGHVALLPELRLPVHVPDPDGAVGTGRGQRPSVGAERDGRDGPGPTAEDADAPIGARVPEPDRPVGAGGSERPVAAERDAVDPAFVGIEDVGAVRAPDVDVA